MDFSERCFISSSQEYLLRHSRFVGEPDSENDKNDSEDSREGETPQECTGIMMMSVAESSEENDRNLDNDVFQTPPEGSLNASSGDNRNDRTVVVKKETASGCTDGENKVNLGVDTDLGLSEVESPKFEGVNEVVHCESNTVSALKRKSVTENCLSGCPMKKAKLLSENLVSEAANQFLDSESGEKEENIIKSQEKSNSNRVGHSSCRSESLQISEGGSAKRKLDFTTELLELETEVIDRDLVLRKGLENNTRNGEGCSNLGRKDIEDISKFMYVGPTAQNFCQRERGNQGVRALPASICGQPEKDAGKESDLGKNHGEITLLDVLRMLAAKCDYDISLENRSILDVAKSRGMTFP